MSLDVYLEGEPVTDRHWCSCGHEHDRTEAPQLYSRNITHNLTRMASAANVYLPLWRPDELGLTKASELVPLLRAGLAELRSNPGYYRTLNPSNGWGDYDGLVGFITDYLAACEANPDATVRVSR